MATPQGYQQVVMVPTPAVSHGTSRWQRRGIQIGGLMIGLPCAICMAVSGLVFVTTGIAIITADAEIDSDDVFDDDDITITATGIVMLFIGVILIIACIYLCHAGLRAYKNFSQTSAGQVINSSPNVTVAPPASYPLNPPAAYHYPSSTQMNTSSPSAVPLGSHVAGVPVATFPAPLGQQGQYPPAPIPGQGGQYPTTGQPYPYPAAPGGQPGAYPVPGQPGGQYPVVAPYPMAAGAQPSPYPGAYPGPPLVPFQTPAAGPYLSEQVAQVAPEAPGLPQKGGIPGEVAPTAPHDPYDKPPPYAP